MLFVCSPRGINPIATNKNMKLNKSKAAKLATLIADELGIKEIKTLLEIRAKIAGYQMMNPKAKNEEIAPAIILSL